MTVRVERAAWEPLADEWARLVDTAAAPGGAFLAPAFQSAWWEIFGDNATLELHAVRDGDALIGVLPWQRTDDAWSFIGDPEVCDYADLVAAPGRRADVMGAALDVLETGGARTATLWGLPEGSPTAGALASVAEARGWRVEAAPEAVCPTVSVADGWTPYLDALDGRQRRAVRRKLRILTDGGARVGFRAIERPDAITAALPRFLDLMRASRGDKAAFLTDDNERFFRAIVRNVGPTGRLGLYFLQLDERDVAGVLGFDHGGVLMLYNSGYDPALRDRNVGLASKIFCLRHAITCGKRTVDFLRGDEEYKFQLGAVASPVTRVTLHR